MTKWLINPSYKFDLANICNLFTNLETYHQLHPQGWAEFKHLFSHPQFQAIANMLNQQGYLISSALIAIFDSHQYNGEDIDEICKVAEDPGLRETTLRSYFVDNKVLTPQQWQQYGPMMPQLTAMARHLHQGGFLDYWRESCLPEISLRCQEFLAKAGQYPVVEEVNTLLGDEYALATDTVALYLCMFSAPHGSSLALQGFVSDIRWDLETTVAIALHEMLHPPFDRDKLAAMSEELVEDDFVAEARKLLPAYYYPTALNFVEENIVEGAHIFLAEKLGVEDSPLRYLAKHDSGSHVISVLLYDALRQGIAQGGLNLEQIIEKMIAEGPLRKGLIRMAYLETYKQAGLSDLIPKI